jgi:uncharacterized membrane protein YdjX (TVP38/TMEM64 family)
MLNKYRKKIAWVAIALGIVAVIIVFRNSPLTKSIDRWLTDSLVWIKGIGIYGFFAYTLIYAIATVLLLPGSILTLGAGAIYGVVKGTILVSIASTISATVSFLIGRNFLHDWVVKKLEQKPDFLSIDRAIGAEGWKIVVLTRLSPIFPYNLLNYALSLTEISLKDYFWASWIGMIPGTIMYVYIGSTIGDLTQLATGNRSRSGLEWGFSALGLFATIAVTVYITRIAKGVLQGKITNNTTK